MTDQTVSHWPPHQCFEIVEPVLSSPQYNFIHTKHYLFGFKVSERTYVENTANGETVRVK